MKKPSKDAKSQPIHWPRMRRWQTLSLLAVLAFPVFGQATISQKDKCDSTVAKIIATKKKSGTTNILIKLNGDFKDSHRKSLDKLGASVVRNLPIIQSVAVQVPKKNVSKLASLPFVARLSYDGDVKKTDAYTVSGSVTDQAWGNNGMFSGNGVNIAVVDSGIGDHKDFHTLGSDRVLARVNVSKETSTDDKCGHGTHVAGIAAGNGLAALGSINMAPVFGIARSSGLIGVKVLDSKGSGQVSDVIAGIQWVMDNKAQYNIRVMNLSLGHPVGESYTTDPLCQAVEAAWKQGIVVVVAAGNAGRVNDRAASGQPNEGWGTNYGSIQVPGNDPYVITVGAMKSNETSTRLDDKIATYSSRGPARVDLILKPDIVAPGNKVVSTTANNCFLWKSYLKTNGKVVISTNSDPTWGNYFVLSGTSMAAPVVSGVAAMMIAKDSSISPDTVKARLMTTADKWVDALGIGDACTYGAGYVNAYAAVNSKLIANGYALSPTLYVDERGLVSMKWDQLVFGDRAIWGSGINDLRAIWGSSALSGDNFSSLVDADRALWGSNVWNNRAIWGESSGTADLTSVAIGGEQ